MVTNREVARVLYEISEYLEMQDVPFKPRAYEKVAGVIEGLEEEVKEIHRRGGLKALEDIPGVGVSIAEKIEELIKTGYLKYYETLKKKVPVDLGSFEGIEGLGPKSIFKLYKKLGVKNRGDLERAVKAGRIRNLEGFGEKSEENILKSLEFIEKSGGRFVLGYATSQIREIESRLKKLEGVERIIVAGSVRRRKETIRDADFLVTIKGNRPTPTEAMAGKIMDFFVSMPEVARVFAHGKTKSTVKMENGLDVDLRVVPKGSYGAALNYFTGSKDHNVALREIAIKKSYKLNEYGLWKGAKQIAGRTEEELYRTLGLDYIEPEMRENTGEIELARKRDLPNLVDYDDLQGDLQIQSNWGDGANSIEELARAAAAIGLKYIAITDHTKRLTVAHGLDEERIQAQWKEIDKINSKFKIQNSKFRILKGSECDILKDGTMDLRDDILSKLDVVGASVHSNFNMTRKDQTQRIIRAMENPHVDIIFHPTGRVINKREAYEIDMDEIIRSAKKTRTVLEIDAFPDRLDLKDDHIRKCVEAGVKMSIDSDAHSLTHFSYLEYGIAQARRGWAKRGDIINAWPLEKMLKMLKD